MKFRSLTNAGNIFATLIGLTIVTGCYVVMSTHFRRVGLMVPDESYYTLAAREVYRGRLPYSDFAYTQMPHLPYLNGLAMQLTGVGLDSHRLISSIWGGLGILAILLALRKRLGSFEPGLAAAFAVVASPRWCFLQSMGSWCGATGMLLCFALAVLLIDGPFKLRSALFAVFGTLAIGCRLSSAPIVAVLAMAFLVEAKDLGSRLRFLLLCLIIGACTILPFVIPDPEAFLFFNWQFHVESLMERPIPVKAMQVWDIAPAAITILALGLLSTRRLLVAKKWTESILLLSAVVALIVPMIPKGAWGSYVAASAPVAAAAGITAFWAGGMGTGNPHRHVVWLFPLMSLFHMTPLEVIEGAATDTEEVAAFIASEVPAGPLLTPANIIAVEADRDPLEGTEMGKFSAFYPFEEARARRFRMTTLPLITQAVENHEPAAVVLLIEPSGWRLWNFEWALPYFERQPRDAIEQFQNTMADCYRPAWTTSTMEVWVRKAP